MYYDLEREHHSNYQNFGKEKSVERIQAKTFDNSDPSSTSDKLSFTDNKFLIKKNEAKHYFDHKKENVLFKELW